MARTLCDYRSALEILEPVSEAAVLDKRDISLLSPERDQGAHQWLDTMRRGPPVKFNSSFRMDFSIVNALTPRRQWVRLQTSLCVTTPNVSVGQR